MIYKSGIVDCYKAYDYVKNMINEMGNIVAFKAFYNDIDPYYEIVDGRKKYYRLILFDDSSNEFWIDTACGYNGTGPSFTEKILQLVGVREDYNIGNRRVICEKNLILNQDLNVLVVFDSYCKEKIMFMAEMKFDKAYKRINIADTLKLFGDIDFFYNFDARYKDYFHNCYHYVDNTIGEYKTNEILHLDKKLKDISDKDLKKVMNTIFLSVTNKQNDIKFTEINRYIDL